MLTPFTLYATQTHRHTHTQMSSGICKHSHGYTIFYGYFYTTVLISALGFYYLLLLFYKAVPFFLPKDLQTLQFIHSLSTFYFSALHFSYST